ncbi:MAG: polyhydroxyalkanoate depolymerase [Burkholderiales bacterium]|nr:polyhydroxyalkanoate depolymerase [Burkholderiales bacterium]
MMYHAYDSHSDLLWPLRASARLAAPALLAPGPSGRPTLPGKRMAAACRLIELTEVTHRRPAWGIHTVTVAGPGGSEEVGVIEEAVLETPFATLRRFRKQGLPGAAAQPRVLVVAPMSGHFATLLRDTVRTLLRDHDVHVTDWHNVRDVPLAAGRFGLDEYTEHVMRFIRALGEGAHVVAVCQPCVAAFAATALMAEDDDPATPASLTLMAGPMDCRISPTAVNQLATGQPIEWFERNLISTVPWRHRGAGRRVYPGFVQLTAFMSMNKERHLNALADYYWHVVEDEHDKAEATRAFYEEYLAVADLSADFYLETVRLVFQEYALPLGALRWRGRTIDPKAIRRTALLTVEGERDDICSVGQTMAAHDMATSLRPYLRTNYLQAGVGHYGVFSGRRWQNSIYPVVRDVIHVSQ